MLDSARLRPRTLMTARQPHLTARGSHDRRIPRYPSRAGEPTQIHVDAWSVPFGLSGRDVASLA